MGGGGGDRGGKRGKNPPQTPPTAHPPPGAPFVCQPTRRRLEQRVAQKKKTKQRAQPDVGQMIIRSQVCGGDVEIDAVEKGDGAKDKQPSDKQPADAARSPAHAACARKSCTKH